MVEGLTDVLVRAGDRACRSHRGLLQTAARRGGLACNHLNATRRCLTIGSVNLPALHVLLASRSCDRRHISKLEGVLCQVARQLSPQSDPELASAGLLARG